MKRILLSLIAIAILGSIIGHAQSANRKGLFLELRGGATIGTVYQSDDDRYDNYMKGGFDLGLGIGYRFTTSTSWAFQMKLDLSDNLSAPSDYIAELFSTAITFGMRWTSSDFANNKSAYIGVGTGVGIYPAGDDVSVYIPVEIEAGINLTNKLSLGVYTLPKFHVAGDMDYNYSPYYDLDYKSNAPIGIKLGYRF